MIKILIVERTGDFYSWIQSVLHYLLEGREFKITQAESLKELRVNVKTFDMIIVGLLYEETIAELEREKFPLSQVALILSDELSCEDDEKGKVKEAEELAKAKKISFSWKSCKEKKVIDFLDEILVDSGFRKVESYPFPGSLKIQAEKASLLKVAGRGIKLRWIQHAYKGEGSFVVISRPVLGDQEKEREVIEKIQELIK